MMTSAIRISGLTKSYGNHAVLKGIDFCVRQGEIFALLGVSGAGKTIFSAFIHLLIMSVIIYIIAPLVFDAEIPQNPGRYFASLAVFTAVSFSVASIIGLAVKDQAKTSMFSIIIFMPSIMLSGIMFPIGLLPKAFETAGTVFPASWGYRLMAGSGFRSETLLPLLVIFAAAILIDSVLLKKVGRPT